MAVDASGRIYALSTQLGLIRFRKQGHGYIQQSYGAPVPDLPNCVDVAPGTPCAPSTQPLQPPPIVNDIAFDNPGNAYVTDLRQATIWRYPAGGGAPHIRFQDAQLEGGGYFPLGPNGIRH